MSWHTIQGNFDLSTYLQELEAEYSQTSCSATKSSELVKSKTTRAEFYCNGKLTESYLASLSGTTCGHSTEGYGEEKSISSREDFLAQTFLPLGQTTTKMERLGDLKENLQVCGRSIKESSRRFGLNMSGSKTHQISELKDLSESSKILPSWGIMLDGVCLGVGTLERTTTVSECGYLPTPTSHNSKEGAYPAEYTRKTPTLSAQVGGKINPDWNELRMGWPQGWTQIGGKDSNQSVMAKTLEFVRSHGKYSQKESNPLTQPAKVQE